MSTKNLQKKDEVLEVVEALLYKIMYKGAFSNVLLKNDASFNALAPNVKGYVSNVVYGSIENWILINYIIDELAQEPKKIKVDLRCLLVAAIYSLRFLDKKSPAVVVNRFVEYAKYKKPHAKNFVNFILRNYLREEVTLPKADNAYGLSVLYSHPLELVEFFINIFKIEECERILSANNQKPMIHARVNSKYYTRSEVLEMLHSQGVLAIENALSERAIDLLDLNRLKMEELEAFECGAIYVQDISSILHFELVEIKPEDRILDLCAAPGGKIGAIMELCDESNEVIISDIGGNKLQLIKDNLSRLKLDYLRHQILEYDARVYHPAWKEGFDVVIIDVPCSGLGVLRQRPEIRYRFDLKEVKELQKIQYQILENAFEYLKEGGYLIYSTCTINPYENEKQIEKFLKNHKNAYVCKLDLDIDGQIHENMIKLKQSNNKTDGFFACKIGKGRLEKL